MDLQHFTLVTASAQNIEMKELNRPAAAGCNER
jgi:hypothetical protein